MVRPASMGDVAAAAGVSAQTVSRVVNGSARVDPATRARVEEAMARLGYRVNRAARALRTGRSHTIGVVVATLATVGNSRMLEAVASAAARRGLALTVVTLGGPEGVAGAFAHLIEQGVDGAVVLNEATAIAGDAGVPPGLRIVAVDAPVSDGSEGAAASFSTVQSDHAGGAAAATAHLLSRGHRTVHHLAGPATSFAALERERGWREALAGAPEAAVLRGDWTSASGHTAGARWATSPDVTAVFAANDQMALGLIRALAEAGRAVGDDVHVVGFDDVADAADFRPPLTSVRQDFDELGEVAVAALVARISGAEPTRTTLPTRLVIRASA